MAAEVNFTGHVETTVASGYTFWVANLASPQKEQDLLKSPLLDQDGSLWSVDLSWDQTRLGELFFDQVAELEKLIPGESCKENVLEKSWGSNAELFNDGEGAIEECVGPIEEQDRKQAVGICGGDGDAECEDLEMIEQQTFKHSSVLSGEATALFDVSQGSPSSTGSSCSDETSEKRMRNNKASRKFRRARKERHHSLFARASKLEQENQSLKLQVNEMIQEIISLRSMLPKNILQV
ncbi:uncharacterized protein LOC144659390 [Oculina patagonica]